MFQMYNVLHAHIFATERNCLIERVYYCNLEQEMETGAGGRN